LKYTLLGMNSMSGNIVKKRMDNVKNGDLESDKVKQLVGKFTTVYEEGGKVADKVSDIMVKKVITISPDKSLVDAAQLMEKKKIGGLVVVENEKLAGIITESDFVKIAAVSCDVKSAKVKDFMRKQVVTCGPTTPAISAFVFMKNKGIRHLPIVEKGKPVGIITMRNLITKGKMLLFF